MALGIENLKKVVDLGIELEKLGADYVANGKNWTQSLKDSFEHIPAIVADVTAISFNQVIPEAKDLTGDETLELIAHVGAKIAVDSVKAQAIIAASLKLAGDLVVDGIALSKAIRS